jgi:hypothetical protein
MNEPFENFFVACIVINLIVWVVFFIVQYMKKKPITISRCECVALALIAIISSAFGFVVTSIFAFIFIVWLLGVIWKFFEEHWLDNIVEFLSKDLKIK